MTFPADSSAATAQAWVRASNDETVLVYGRQYKYVPIDAAAVRPGSGVWDKQLLILNRPRTIPTTHEKTPVELFPIGELRRGTSDPKDPRFDSRTASGRLRATA